MKNLRKYPQNILFLIVFLLLCIAVIFIIKEYALNKALNTGETRNTSLTFPSKFNLKLNNKLILGSISTPLANDVLEGDAKISLNKSNGDLKVDFVSIDSKILEIQRIDKKIKISSVSLDTTHPSTGTFNNSTGKIDLSACIVLEMNIGNKLNNNKISLIFPLSGKIDKRSGRMNLNGEASLPPDVLGVPMPINIMINASSY